MPLLEPSLRILTKDESSALVAITAEWKHPTGNGFYRTIGASPLPSQKGPIDTCISNFSLKQERLAWPTTVGVFSHDLAARNGDETFDKLVTRRTKPGSEVVVPAHPLVSYADRFKNLADYVEKHAKVKDMNHVVFIDAPHPDEIHTFDEAVGHLSMPAPASNVRLLLFIDASQMYLARHEKCGWATLIHEESASVFARHARTVLPGFEIVLCQNMRTTSAFATIFGTFKHTHHETTYRADTLTIPESLEIDFARTSCVHTSKNVSRSSLTVGSRTFAFQAAPTGPVSIVFFANLRPDVSTQTTAEHPDLSSWYANVRKASDKDTTNACSGGIALMSMRQEEKAAVVKDALVLNMHAICVNNAKDKWSSTVNASEVAQMDAIMPPPIKRPCLVPAHSCSVPY